MAKTYKNEVPMHLYNAIGKIDSIWGANMTCSTIDKETSMLTFHYKWFGTKGKIEITGDNRKTSLLEVIVSSESPEHADKIYRKVEGVLGLYNKPTITEK